MKLGSFAARYEPLRLCIGSDNLDKVQRARAFMIGCGAIGCEMLKNLALIGFSTTHPGQLTVTDHDLIEKSNLNRQFLFRPKHIRQHKSVVSAQAAREINPDIKVEPLLLRVGPETERGTFTDQFFASQDVVVNALDNVEARRYVDGRCVTAQRALLDSGTMGPKGHVQVVVPFKTESYAAQNDPVDESVPYCTLKTFPQRSEHCVEWAREKFESSFTCKPGVVAKYLKDGGSQHSVPLYRFLRLQPHSWTDCLLLARDKFVKYFDHRAKHILHAFPHDTKQADGSPFWSPPKRAPIPQEFSVEDPLHLGFVLSVARLYAQVFGIEVDEDVVEVSKVREVLAGSPLPQFVPSCKRIEVSEEKTREEVEASKEAAADDPEVLGKFLDELGKSPPSCRAVVFEKDEEEHIEVLTCMSVLRARMYGLPEWDKVRVKKVSGRIVPAIATTTAAVAGLVTAELLKLLCGLPDQSRNSFLNLALPFFLLSEPGACQKQPLPGGRSFTAWDRWDLRGVSPRITVAEFLDLVQQNFSLRPSAIAQGVKMVYTPLFPGHRKRLTQALKSFLTLTDGRSDLIILYEPEASSDDDDITGPPVRVHFAS